MRTATCLTLLVLTTACTGKSDDDSSTDGFAPAEGTWVEVSETELSDGCGFGDDDDDDSGSDADLQLTDTGDGTFSVQVGGGDSIPFEADCTLTDQDFTCGSLEAAREDFASEGLDAMLVLTVDMDGSFSSSTDLTVDLTITADCEGDSDDCGFVADAIEVDFPCEAVTRIEMEHAG